MMRLYLRHWRSALFLLLSVSLILSVVPPVEAQQQVSDPVLQIMELLPTRQKVGQLVMVSYPGAEVGEDSLIADLVRDYAVGGVLLRPENGNFGAQGSIGAATFLSMTNQLQQTTWRSAQEATLPAMGINPYLTNYVPLLIAVDSDVNSLPISSLVSGTATLPSAMALGATWSRALAEASGQLMGRELTSLGVNLYLGPDFDVLNPQQSDDPALLGTSVFGGHAYWVGELGQAYLRGLHQGSGGALAVIPKHFPGIGSIDRPLNQEVPTVQRTLEQLQQSDLAAFSTIVEGMPGTVSAADGLLIPHVRYSGLQGSIRSSTRPISLDAQALSTALEAGNAENWRSAEGLLVADNLGMESLQRFDDPEGLSFNARRLARDALLAGNDLLILDRFAVSGTWEDHLFNVRDTLDFLAQSYENDPTFQARVDEALYRILSLKLRLYPELVVGEVERSQEELSDVLSPGENVGVDTQVAMSAISRLVPATEDLLPPAPREGEQFLIFTQQDAVSLGDVGERTRLSLNAVQRALELLYGVSGTGQVQPGTVGSFTFQNLLEALETPVPAEPAEDVEGEEIPLPLAVRNALGQADWIIFAATDLSESSSSATALLEFLRQEAGLVDGRVIVFDFGAPYGLTSTDFSKVDAYYALYDTGDAFVQAAVRALFRDLPAAGAPPVTIPALNYDLNVQTTPDPNQLISFTVVQESGQPMTEEEKNNIRKDDVIYLRTSVIVDRNGNPVPDGTPVEFILTYPQEDRVETIAAESEDGVAFVPITLDRVGQLDITVESDPVAPFYHLQLTIREGQSVVMISVTPTPEVEGAPPTVEPEPETPPKLPEPLRLPLPRGSRLLAWAGIGAAMAGALGFIWAREQNVGAVRIVKIALWCVIGGLVGYVVTIACIRWVFPGWVHWLSGREMLSGGVSLLSGVIVLASVLLQRLRRLGALRE
jgi:beta-N-acetylhexosaminidase